MVVKPFRSDQVRLAFTNTWLTARKVGDAIVKAIKWTAAIIIVIWLLNNMLTLATNVHWYEVERQAQIEACREFAQSHGVNLRWSDRDGCH